jgi:polysaccharide pyruvyl transferase WcaK-like protein
VNVGLLGATLEHNNKGIHALAVGTVESILSAFPDAHVCMLDYSMTAKVHRYVNGGKEVSIPLINIRFSKKVYLRNHIIHLILLAALMRVFPMGKWRKRIVEWNPWMREIEKVQYFLSIAGGDSFSDIYGLRRFFYMVLPQILVIVLKKPLVQLPQTYGPYNKIISLRIAKYIIERSSMIYSRDYEGLKEIKKIFSPSNSSDRVRFSHDMGFALPPEIPSVSSISFLPLAVDKKPLILGINVSGLLHMGGYTRDNMFNLRMDYRNFVRQLIEYAIVKKNASVLLIPHVFGASEHSESDLMVCEKFYDEFKSRFHGKIFVVRGNYSPGEIKWIIGQCNWFVGARMHACIGALSQCVPTVPIAYSKKFFGVMETIGVESMVVDARTISNEEAFRIVDRLFSEHEVIRRSLEARIPCVLENVLGLVARTMSSGYV